MTEAPPVEVPSKERPREEDVEMEGVDKVVPAEDDEWLNQDIPEGLRNQSLGQRYRNNPPGSSSAFQDHTNTRGSSRKRTVDELTYDDDDREYSPVDTQAFNDTGARTKQRNDLYCNHCRMPGHEDDRCFRLHPELKFPARSFHGGPAQSDQLCKGSSRKGPPPKGPPRNGPPHKLVADDGEPGGNVDNSIVEESGDALVKQEHSFMSSDNTGPSLGSSRLWKARWVPL